MRKLFSEQEAKEEIAYFIANEFIAQSHDRDVYVNLGIGIPTGIAPYLEGSPVFVHSENGMFGVGAFAKDGEEDEMLINAGRAKVTETNGCCYFDSADSFGIVRGGHLDATVIGAFEVDALGNVANWIIPGGKMLGMGGAMDLVSGAKKVYIAMRHLTNDGRSKLVPLCKLPITGVGVVDTVVTEYAVFRFVEKQMRLTHKSDAITREELREITDFEYTEEI